MASIRFNGREFQVDGTVKVYGNQRTNLILSEAAERIYLDTDPLTIYEVTTDEGQTEYWLDGVVTSGPLNADEVNAALVALAED